MRTILGFIGILYLIAAVVGVVFWLAGDPGLAPLVPGFVMAGIVFLALAQILERLTSIELLLNSSRDTATDRVKTDLGDFERLGNVEGQATCLGCRKTVPKAGLYYHKAMDVYYHPECLARDRSR